MRFLKFTFVIVILLSVQLFAFDFDINDAGDLVEALSKLKVEGTGYFYYTHDASKGDGQSNSFDFARMYFGATYRLSDNFSVRYLSDFSHQDKTGKFEVFAKYAYVDWKLNDKFNLIMGLQGTSNWKEPENAWGYRSIQYAPMESFRKFWGEAAERYTNHIYGLYKNQEVADNTLILRRYRSFSTANKSGLGSSADMGVSIKFKPSSDYYIDLSVFNGSGYKKQETDEYKNVQLRFGTHQIDRRLHISGYIEAEPWSGGDQAGKKKQYMNVQWDMMASFKRNGIFSVGVDLNGKNFDGIEIIKAMNYSVFGNFHVLQEKLKVLARYDYYSTGFDDAEKLVAGDQWKTNGSLIIIGLDYIAHKNIHIIPNFQMLSYEDSAKDSENTVYVHLSFNF